MNFTSISHIITTKTFTHDPPQNNSRSITVDGHGILSIYLEPNNLKPFIIIIAIQENDIQSNVKK
jgi:hypothetical protein